MAADPLVKNGKMKGQLFPYWIALERSQGNFPIDSEYASI